MNAPPYNTPQFVFPPGGEKAPACCQRPELMMSNQQFRTPFHNENHRPLMRSSVSTNRYSPYKVYLCLNFQRGNCNYGDKCRFAHCGGDLRREPLPRFDNPSRMSKVRLCWRYSNGGQCPFGERCHFIHDNSRKSVAISVVNRGGGDGGSGGEVKGGLNTGKQVYQRPVAVKTRLCNKWVANGSCPYGHKCIFAHGESELMKSENGKASAYVTIPKTQVLGHPWKFKWTDIEKISRIYADWIENIPLVHDKSDTKGN